MTITKRILSFVFILIFFAGITIGMIGWVICTRDNENYQELQPELYAPDEIATVLQDEDLFAFLLSVMSCGLLQI